MNNTRLNALVENYHHPKLIRMKHHKERLFDFTIKGKSRNWETRFVFDELFPFSLPKVLLLEDDYIGRIPHVNIKGTLCINESDSIITNYNVPEDLIGSIIESAVDLLEFGSLKINFIELTDEYEGFFEPISDHIPGYIVGGDDPQKIYIKICRPNSGKQVNEKPFIVLGDGIHLSDHFSNFSRTNSFQNVKSIYIPLEFAMLPPQGRNGLTMEYIYELVSHTSSHHSKAIGQITNKIKPSKVFYILFGIPRSTGTRSLILFQLKNTKKIAHPFIEKSMDWDIRPFLIDRHDKEYLLERGGADLNLSNKRVAIIGCGSVGSEIALMLAKAGVGHLTLIDFDVLEIDNIYRHRLGGEYLNYEPDSKSGKVRKYYKSKALENYLSKNLPHIETEVITKPVEEIIEGKELKNADIIISAIGSPAKNLFLNQKFKVLNYKKIIYCWNEALSVGGHALAVNLDSSCYECQFWNEDGFSLTSPFNLVSSGQHLTKNLTGCAGVFTPFSYLDSSQTAMIAARLCLEVINSDSVNKIASWKNKNEPGIQLTERYYEMELLEEHTYTKSSYCENCCHG